MGSPVGSPVGPTVGPTDGRSARSAGMLGAAMTIDETELRLAWERAVGRSRAARSAFESVLTRHREPHRRYHGVRHVVWVVRHVHSLATHEPVADPDAVVVAACYHDAVYTAGRDRGSTTGAPASDEAASAELARRELADLGDPAWPVERIDRVAGMIRATAHLATDHHVDGPAHDPVAHDPVLHDPVLRDPVLRDPVHDPVDGPAGRPADTDVLLDADLAVLGSPPNAYQTYVNGVRAEYSHVDASAWRMGRRAVLEAFVARPTIYRTPTAVGWWEARARANLAAELAALSR